MPIPSPKKSEKEDEYISRCISEIGNEYDAEGQAYAICKGEFDKPVKLAEHETEPELENLPDVKANETEESYLDRCIPVLYPEKYDQRIAASYCADHYQKKVTVTELKNQNLKTMKAENKSKFDLKREEFIVNLELARFAEEGGTYDWDQCIADQTERYGDEETAQKVCGAIKAANS